MNCFGKTLMYMFLNKFSPTSKLLRGISLPTKKMESFDRNLSSFKRKTNKLGGISLYNESYNRHLDPKEPEQKT